MSDTGGFPLAFGSSQFAGKSNRTRVQGNAWGWENLGTAPMSAAFGYRNKVSGTGAFAFGSNNTASADGATACGNSNLVSGSNGAAFGSSNTVSGQASVAIGTNLTLTSGFSGGFGASGTISENNTFGFGYRFFSSRRAELVHSSGQILTTGDCQHGWLVAFGQTTNATPTVIYIANTATFFLTLSAGTRMGVTVEIVAATTGAINKSARFVRSFQIDRPTTAASTTLVGSVQTVGTDTGTNSGTPPAGWAVSITADTTNGAPQFQVTGDSSTINWTAAIHYVQTIQV